MKEKTFDEILEDYMAYESMTETQKLFVKNMMQQVREATIAECADIELDSYSSVETQRRIENLPTDRIKTEK